MLLTQLTHNLKQDRGGLFLHACEPGAGVCSLTGDTSLKSVFIQQLRLYYQIVFGGVDQCSNILHLKKL